MNSQNQNFGPDQNLNQRFDQNYLQNFNQSYPSQFGNQQSQIEMLAQQFYNQYNASIQSIQIGDVNQAEFALHGATNTIQILGNQLPPNEFRIFKVMHQQIETSFKVAKAINLYNEERFEKAGFEVASSSEICDAALQSFNQLSMNMVNNYELAKMLPIIKNSFLFFKIQIEAYKKMIASEVDKLNNKFTDELAMLREV